MSMSGFLIRFSLIQVALLTTVTVVLGLLDVEGNSGVGIAVLFGSVSAACLWFAKKNGRYFTGSEKRIAIVGMVVINLALQLLSVWVAARQAAAAGSGLEPGSGLLWIVTAISCTLDAAVIWYTVRSVGKQVAKQAATVPQTPNA